MDRYFQICYGLFTVITFILIHFSCSETKNAVAGKVIESNRFQDSVPLSSSPTVSRNQAGFPRYCVVPHIQQLYAA